MPEGLGSKVYLAVYNLDLQHHPNFLGFSFLNCEMRNSGQTGIEDAFHSVVLT